MEMNLFNQKSSQGALDAVYLKFANALNDAFSRIDRKELLEDRSYAIINCNRWILMWYLLEPDIACLEGFEVAIFESPDFLKHCVEGAGKDTTIMWDLNNEQFWNKPDPSESAIKLGKWIRTNWKNIKR